MAIVPIQWTRFWFPAGNAISSIDGYLPDPDGWMSPDLDVQGRRIEALNDIPCLIMLGIPGMGKTSEMKHAADHAREAGELVDLISLARLASPAELNSRLLAGPNLQEWLRGKPWNVFLDGLDEALAQLTQIEKAIPELVRSIAQLGNGLDNFRLRISCRSAEWPQALEAELRSLWDKNGVKAYELGHLRHRDVALAVEREFQSESQRQSFFQYVQDHEAEPLASRPVTLNMLLNVFRHESELPKQQVQLYRRGLLASIEEANDVRRQSLQTWRLDPRSKLMVAARIAASCLFSNRSEIWIGHQSQVAPGRAVILSEIAGGYEPSLLSSFHVGEVELREALLTSLFVPIGPDLFGWTHQTFAEFLSAYYLVEHQLTADDILDFLRGSGEVTGQIAPQLIEVAAWVASMQPEFFRTLVRFEPAILLRSDVAAALPEDREALVRELLRKFDNAELHDFHQDFRSRYGRFNHPRLEQQLQPYILAKDKNRIVRRVAIDIAVANNLTNLADLLAGVALDTTTIYTFGRRLLRRCGVFLIWTRSFDSSRW
jgi:hypothetical protein